MQQQQQPPPTTPPPATSQSQPATQSQPAQAAPATPQAAPQSPAQPQPQFNPQQVTPVVQIEAPRRSEEVGVEDVLIGSFALIGILIAAALIVGLLTGGIFIAIQRWRDKNAPDAPAEPEATRLNLSQHVGSPNPPASPAASAPSVRS
jgi:hypothetical protein